MEDNQIDVAGICETWLTDSYNVTTAIIKSYGFSMIHDHRDNQKGGGTAIIYKPIYDMSVVKLSKSFKSFEFTSAMLKASQDKVMLIIMYRTGALTSVYNQELDSLLSDCSRMCDNIILAGDLNIHFSSTTWLSQQTLDIMNSYSLSKLVNVETHCSGGSLDQIFFSSKGKVVQPTVSVDRFSGLGSDHYPVICSLRLHPDKKYFKKIVYRNLKEIDGDTFSNDLNVIVDGIDSKDSFETQVKELTTAVNCLRDEHAPIVTKDLKKLQLLTLLPGLIQSTETYARNAEEQKRKSISRLNIIRYIVIYVMKPLN